MGFFDFFKQADINQGVKEYTATPGAVLLDVLKKKNAAKVKIDATADKAKAGKKG